MFGVLLLQFKCNVFKIIYFVRYSCLETWFWKTCNGNSIFMKFFVTFWWVGQYVKRFFKLWNSHWIYIKSRNNGLSACRWMDSLWGPRAIFMCVASVNLGQDFLFCTLLIVDRPISNLRCKTSRNWEASRATGLFPWVAVQPQLSDGILWVPRLHFWRRHSDLLPKWTLSLFILRQWLLSL